MKIHICKKRVKESFNKRADLYDKKTLLQKKIMAKLFSYFCEEEELKYKLDKKKLLELGCGTAEFSRILSREISFASIDLLDISPRMLDEAKKKLNSLNTFLVEKDFDSFSKYNNYALIASNMSLHWSENFFELLNKILSMMRVNAFFIFSVPNNKSFQILKKEKFGNLINSFPEQKLILKNIDKRFQVKIYESNFFQKFNSFIDFFKSLDEIGAGTSNKEIDFKKIPTK